MTLPVSPNSISADQIRTEFGAISGIYGPVSLGAYRISQTVSGLENMPLDTGIPQSGPIKFSDFYKCYPNAIGVYLDDKSYICTKDVQDISKIENIDGTFGAMLKVLVLIEIYKFQKITISI